MARSLLFSLIMFSLSAFALASYTTLSNAVETLSNSGYLSMALTLQLTLNTLNLDSKSITIFAPSDLAFLQSGQLSLLQLQHHISPLILSQDTLKTLPLGSRIPTLLSNHSLIVTTSDYNAPFSVNGVFIEESPVYDGGFLVVYGMDEFFNTSFHIGTSTFSALEPSPSSATQVNNNSSQSELKEYGCDVDVFGKASNYLKSRGYSIMATFLGMQLAGFKEYHTRLTIFAPLDTAVEAYVRNVTDYLMIFRQHVVPRLLTWQDLVRLGDGTILPTFSEGFVINVTWSGDVLVLNGIPVVVFPDLYISKSLVLHGLSGLLMTPVNQKIIGDSFSEFDMEDYQNPPDNN